MCKVSEKHISSIVRLKKCLIKAEDMGLSNIDTVELDGHKIVSIKGIIQIENFTNNNYYPELKEAMEDYKQLLFICTLYMFKHIKDFIDEDS